MKIFGFDFGDRINRRPYLFFAVIAAILNAVILAVAASLGNGFSKDLLLAIAFILTAVFHFHFVIGRFHDLGKSGYWIFGLLVPILNLFLGCLLLAGRGTPGPNKYGPDPLSS